MMNMRTCATAIGAIFAGLMAATPASAVVVANSLPFIGTPDWSDISTGGGATITVSNGVSTLTTAPSRGTWFGWAAAFNPPAWSIASNAQGNYLSLSARFSAGAADWTAYLLDGTRRAEMRFNPTFCNAATTNCYAFAGVPGVSIDFGSSSTFIALDTSQFITYEFLLLGDQVTYRIGGASYTGLAASSDDTFLLVGDRTGSSLSGTGQMFINAVSFDSGTLLQGLPDLTGSVVPEPGTWAMLIAGFGLVGAMQRRRRRSAFSA